MLGEVVAPYQRSLSSIPQAPRVAVTLALGLVLTLIMSACFGQPVDITPTATTQPTATPVPCSAWRMVSSPNHTELPQSVLSAVSALSPQMAVAVGGSFREGNGAQSLIQQWDGTSWRIVANPGNDFLSGVAAVSPTDMWAVGAVRTGQPNPPVALIEHWNGTQWSIVLHSASTSALTGVVALAANDIWAVGMSEDHPLAERWDGASWQVVATPTPTGADASDFAAVTRIPGTRQLWAVGSAKYPPPPGEGGGSDGTTGSDGYFQALIERWDGVAWQVIAPPALPAGAFGSTLSGVVALSPTDAWAVGNYTASDHTIRTLIAHWDGTTWQVVASPDIWGSLASVAAAGPNDVRAVGYVTGAGGYGYAQRVLIEHWDGAMWRTAAVPAPDGASHSSLSGITTDSAGNFWAVGSYKIAAGNSRTLIERCQ